MVKGPAFRRYNRSVLMLSAAYAVFLLVDTYLFKHQLVSGVPAYLMATLPALPIVGMFAAIGRYLIEETDEYVRMLMVRQSLVASAFALSVATIWGFLQAFDLAAHFDAYWIAVWWFAGLGIGDAVNKIIAARSPA